MACTWCDLFTGVRILLVSWQTKEREWYPWTACGGGILENSEEDGSISRHTRLEVGDGATD